jgi:hypothetical protein
MSFPCEGETRNLHQKRDFPRKQQLRKKTEPEIEKENFGKIWYTNPAFARLIGETFFMALY